MHPDEEGFCVVWNPLHGNPTFRHPGYESALTEAKRLARENPGQEFFVLRACTKVRVIEPIEVVRLADDDLPF